MWLLLALLTAFFTSLMDVFGKKLVHTIDVAVIAWGTMFFSLPFLYAFLIIEGIPPIGPS